FCRFNDSDTVDIYTLSLHDALPIYAMTRQLDEARRMVERNSLQLERTNFYLESILSSLSSGVLVFDDAFRLTLFNQAAQRILRLDRKSTRLNSSHVKISYAVFCLKK